ncbi:MAG: amidase [Bryobacterales bacterium]|nr:amidase [Bryobacterales bacterium]
MGRRFRRTPPNFMMDRRQWVQLLALLTAADAASCQQQAPAPEALPITKDILQASLKAMGLEFTPEQLDLMLPNVNRSLRNFEGLRKIDVPLDTEPAFHFNPGTVALPKKASFQPSKPKPRRDWKKIDDLAFYPLTDLAALVKAKKVTSTDLTKLYIDRLKTFSPKLNFAVTITSDLALDQARRADTEIRRGKYKGPLHGIPWGAKDLFATKGIPTTWGAEPFQNQVFDYDAEIVSRLHNAGAVLVAKLSMGALAMGGLWFGGMTKTPWNMERTSSGSSAGSASATAAGCVGFAIGTETLGSIISPSVRCGAVGLRPTYDKVSRKGAMALSWTMDKVGPICRGVEDCALVLRELTSVPFHWQPRKPLSQLRIGILKNLFEETKGDEGKLFAQALADLKRAGVKAENVTYPEFNTSPLLAILSAEGATAFDDITRDGRVGQLKDQGPGAWPNSFRSSRLIPAVEYIRAQRARTLLQKKFEAFLSKYDVLVSPPHAGDLLTVTNLTGHPQIVVPCGFVEGLPRGLAFTGRLHDEGAPMRVALAFEQATNWHNQHPPLT